MTDETALTIHEEQIPSLLIGTPDDRVMQATQIANALAPVITGKHLFVDIGGKRHVLYEGWTTLGALVGVFPMTSATRQDEDGAWARVEARTLSGALVGAAEAVCTRDETSANGKQRWRDAPDYAVLSMAQTRAGSKALRMPLGFIMQLAGFEGTPAEEMDGVQRAEVRPATDKQRGLARGLLEKYVRREGGAKAVIEQMDALPEEMRSIFSVLPDGQLAPVLGNLSSKQLSSLIDVLKAELGE